MKRSACQLYPLPLVIEDTGDGRHYVSRAPFEYRCGPISIHVESNCLTDFASVPRAFWRVCPPMGPWNRPAYIHDHCYTTGCVPRIVADSIFVDGMLACGVPAVIAWAMYLAVRLCGRCHYRRVT